MVSGQSLVIKECIQIPTDLTAFTKARIDNNGEYCALIKIEAPNINIIIQGNVIGDVEKFGSQYWCYVTNGTKQLVILSDECSSINVKFEDYGFYSVAGRRTYFVNIGTSDNIDISNDSTSIKSSHLGNSPYYSVIDSKKIPAKQAHNKCRTVILDDYAALTLQKASEYNKKETGTMSDLYFFQPFMPMGSFYFPMNSTKFIRKGNTYTISYKNGEYWVYLTSGSKSLGIKHPDFMPLTVTFSDFNISSIESKGCYVMQLEHERKLKSDRNAFLFVAKKAHDNDNFTQEDFEEMIYQYSVFVDTYNQWWDDIDEAKKYNDERGLESYRKIAKTQKMVMLWEGAKHMAIVLDRANKNNLLSEDNLRRYNFMDIERRKLHNRISRDGEGLYRY